MNKLAEEPHFKKVISNSLTRISNALLLNASFTDNIGLLNGKMGIAIFFFKYGEYTGNKIVTNYAGELIDEIYEDINTNTPLDFADGLTGIGWGIEYLAANRFVDADTDEALAEIDKVVYDSIYSHPGLLEKGNDLFGYGFYSISRLHNHEKDFKESDTLINKEHLSHLTGKYETLLVHKGNPESDIRRLSAESINFILWFLLELERLDLFPSKVENVLKCLPEYIFKEEYYKNYRSDWHILHELTKWAALKLRDNALKQQYKLLLERIENLLQEIPDKEAFVLEDLQAISYKKLIYDLYLNDVILNVESLTKLLEIFDNEETWSRRMDGINKSNLGLTGLAGIGLMLLDVVRIHSTSTADSILQK